MSNLTKENCISLTFAYPAGPEPETLQERTIVDLIETAFALFDVLEASEKVLAAVSTDVYRIAAAQVGKADAADEAIAALREAVNKYHEDEYDA